MTRRKAAGLLIGLPLALGFSTGFALAQDPSTTVSKSSSPPAANSPAATATTTTGSVTKPQGLTQPQEELRPSINGGEEPTGAAPPADEIAPAAMDEGAGWEAAVEAAPGPTPLIGDQETKAVQRINAYFNGITNLQGSFDQVNSTNKHATGRFYVQRPGKIRFDYAPPSSLRIVADGAFLAIEDFGPENGREISHQVDTIPPSACRCCRSWPRCAYRRGRKPGRDHRHLARRQ